MSCHPKMNKQSGEYNFGGSNRLIYDTCSYKKWLKQSTLPLSYSLYQGKYENCGKCIKDKYYAPFDLVDVESELRNQTRAYTTCDQYKYNPKCGVRSGTCLSTMDPSMPTILESSLCPIIHNNIPVTKKKGIRAQKKVCSDKKGVEISGFVPNKY